MPVRACLSGAFLILLIIGGFIVKLISYSSSQGGGMLGGYSSTSITYSEDGRCKVSCSNKPMHNQPTEHITYYADGLLEKFSELCERYNVISWTDLPDLNITMLDAGTSTDTFTFEGGTIISLSSGKQLPVQARIMFQELAELLNEAKDNALDIEVIQVEENMMPMGMMGNQLLKNAETNIQSINAPQSAKFCSNCGSKFSGEQKFCPECGTKR